MHRAISGNNFQSGSNPNPNLKRGNSRYGSKTEVEYGRPQRQTFTGLDQEPRSNRSPECCALTISAQSLRIDYDDVAAVRNLDIQVRSGEILGLLGPNGAGKTSTIKALAGILEPTYGTIVLAGIDMDLHPEECWKHLGYMPDFSPVYESLTVGEYLRVFATAHQIPRRSRFAKAAEWAERVDLQEKWDTRASDLSRGMRQRLVLAKTLLHEPSVLLLDEPASGMDPIARVELRALLKDAAGRGAAVIISSHILPELADLCTSIGVMEKGRMVAFGSLDQIRAQSGIESELIVRSVSTREVDAIRLREVFSTYPGIQNLSESAPGTWTANFSGKDEDAAELLRKLIASEIPVADFHVKKQGLEDIFMQIGARETS